MRTINVQDTAPSEVYSMLVGVVAPRPVAFVSTTDAAGNVNLSPFSFFNLFSANPPILVFAPLSRMRDNTSKHTLDNVLATKEAVINIANFALVEQMSLASTEYGKEVNEFVKAGLTPEAAVLVRPPRVKEAPVAIECQVNQVIKLGTHGGAGNLVLCEVLLLHIHEAVLDASGKIDPQKLDAVARLGGDYYLRASGNCLFTLPKPGRQHGIGIDLLPDFIRRSARFSGRHLAQLATVPAIPAPDAVAAAKNEPIVAYVLNKYKGDTSRLLQELEQLAINMLNDGNVQAAWHILLLTGQQ